MIASLEDKAQTLLKAALARGADEAQVIADHRVSARVVYEKNDFNISTDNTHAASALLVHKNQRKGSAVTNESTPEALADAAARAVTLAGFSIPDEHLVLPGVQKPVDLPGRFDESLAQLSAAALHSLAADFIAAAKEEPRLSLDGGELDVTVNHRALANSQGLAVADRVTRVSWTLMGMGKTEEEVTSFDYLTGSSWDWQSASSRSVETARSLTRKLMATFGARKGESYKGAVLLSPAVLGELLFGVIQYHVSGFQIMDGKSRWGNALGEKIAADGFTLTDNPFNLDLMGAAPFDAEGVSVKAWPLIERGVLKTHVDSTYTAKRRGTKSTGHAGGFHGLELAPGDRSEADLLKAADRLVVVERFSGNVDRDTGDFSGVAKGSHYYKRGEHQHPLTETMIAGNVFELLKNIVALSDRAEPWCNAYQAPWLLAEGVSVTAG